MRIKTPKKIEERGSVRSGGNEKGLFLSPLFPLETAHSLFWAREKENKIVPTSSFSFFACTQERERIWGGEEGGGGETVSKTVVKRICRREIDSSICHGRNLCTRCRYARYLRVYSTKTSTSIKRWDLKDKTTETRTQRNVFRPPFVGYELLIITICELFYAFSFSLSFSSSLPSPSNATALFKIARLCFLRAASTFNYTTPDN